MLWYDIYVRCPCFRKGEPHSVVSGGVYTAGLTKKEYENELNKTGNYTRIANELIVFKHLDCYAKCIFMFIAMNGEGWKGSRNEIVRTLRLNKRTVTDRLAILEAFNIIKKYEYKHQWVFEINPRNQWDSSILEANSRKSGARGAPLDVQDGAHHAPIDAILGAPDAPVPLCTGAYMHHDRCAPCTDIGAPDAPPLYNTKDLKLNKNFLEKKSDARTSEN